MSSSSSEQTPTNLAEFAVGLQDRLPFPLYTMSVGSNEFPGVSFFVGYWAERQQLVAVQNGGEDFEARAVRILGDGLTQGEADQAMEARRPSESIEGIKMLAEWVAEGMSPALRPRPPSRDGLGIA